MFLFVSVCGLAMINCPLVWMCVCKVSCDWLESSCLVPSVPGIVSVSTVTLWRIKKWIKFTLMKDNVLIKNLYNFPKPEYHLINFFYLYLQGITSNTEPNISHLFTSRRAHWGTQSSHGICLWVVLTGKNIHVAIDRKA